MMFSKIVICLVALFALAHGLSSFEKQLYKNVDNCCKNSCSEDALDHLHNSLSQYMLMENVDQKIADFGTQVLGGKRCEADPETKSDNSRARAPRASPSLAPTPTPRPSNPTPAPTQPANVGFMNISCPATVQWGGSVRCTISAYSPAGIYASYTNVPDARCYSGCGYNYVYGLNELSYDIYITPSSDTIKNNSFLVIGYFYTYSGYYVNAQNVTIKTTGVAPTFAPTSSPSTPRPNYPTGVPTDSPSYPTPNPISQYGSMNVSCPSSVPSGQLAVCNISMFSNYGIEYSYLILSDGYCINDGCDITYYSNGTNRANYQVTIQPYSGTSVNGYFWTSDDEQGYSWRVVSPPVYISVYGTSAPTVSPGRNISLDCPSYVFWGETYVNCTIEITDPRSIYYVSARATGQYGNTLWCPKSYSNECYYYLNSNSTSFKEIVSFQLDYYTGNFVNISALYYTSVYASGPVVSSLVTVYGSPTPTNSPSATPTVRPTQFPTPSPTRGPTPNPGNGTEYMTILCPSTMRNNQYVYCYVSAYSPYGINQVYVYSNIQGSSCYGCGTRYAYGATQFNYYIEIYSYSSNYVSIDGYFYNYNGRYIYAPTARVNVLTPNLTLTSFNGPSVLPSNFQNFNIELKIKSEYQISDIYVVYYARSNNNNSSSTPVATAEYNYYYNSNSSNANGTFTLTASKYNSVSAGQYCAEVLIYDIAGWSITTNGSCFTVLSTGCDAGYYSSLNKTTGKYRCLACPQGFYAANPDSLRCDACQPGYTSACVLGSRSCVSCAPGTSSSQGVCKACDAGTFSSSYGRPTCSVCSPGQYANGTGNTYCNYCNSGEYSNAGANSCSTCPAGTYNPYAGNSVCQKCFDGYSSRPGSYSCQQCPENTYAVSGDARCTPCPAGQTSPPGAFTCYAAKK